MLNKKTPEVYVLGRRIAMSANKARRVIDQIRGRSYEETLIILELMPYRASYQILKLVYSAASNASYTMAANKANLVISKAEVNEGTARKKLKPRARGRSYPIKRPTCHITIVLKDISFNDSESVELSLLKKSQAKKNSRTKAYSDIQNRRYLWDKK